MQQQQCSVAVLRLRVSILVPHVRQRRFGLQRAVEAAAAAARGRAPSSRRGRCGSGVVPLLLLRGDVDETVCAKERKGLGIFIQSQCEESGESWLLARSSGRISRSKFETVVRRRSPQGVITSSGASKRELTSKEEEEASDSDNFSWSIDAFFSVG